MRNRAGLELTCALLAVIAFSMAEANASGASSRSKRRVRGSVSMIGRAAPPPTPHNNTQPQEGNTPKAAQQQRQAILQLQEQNKIAQEAEQAIEADKASRHSRKPPVPPTPPSEADLNSIRSSLERYTKGPGGK